MIQFLSKILRWGELAGILLTASAILLKITEVPLASQLFLIGLSTLAIIYFLMGFAIQPLNPGKKKIEFIDLVVNKLQKIMYIGVSVLCISYLFTILHLNGANEMMLIGLFTLLSCLVVSMIMILLNRDRMTLLKSPLVRSLALLVFYFITPFLK
jgi:hypothetical protein